MSSRVVRWLSVAVVAFAFSGLATAQEPPKKPEPKPEPKKEEPKKEEPKVEKKEEKKAEGKDIVATVAEQKLAKFAELLKTAGLDKELTGPGPFTVFAPTDDAFKKIELVIKDMEKPENKEKLAKIIKCHIVKGKMMKADIEKAKEPIKCLEGDVKVEVKGADVMLDNAKVAKADIAASNGVIHIVDTVLMPDEKKAEEKKPEKKPEAKPEAKPEKKPEEKKPEKKP